MRVLPQLAATLLSLALAAPAFACSCVYPAGSRSDHVRREFNQSTNVFSAYVVSEYRSESPDSRRMVRLRVLQVWKGELKPNSWLDLESDGASGLGCGLEVELDSAILAYTSDNALASCSMTGALDKSTQDIPLLNRLARARM